MSYPAATSGLGIPAKVSVTGNESPSSSVPGKNQVTISLSGANSLPQEFQLEPILEDAGGNVITPGTAFVLTASAAAAAVATYTLSAAAAAVNGDTVYTGTGLPAANTLVGRSFTVAGFVTAANNGSFVATANTTTTLTLANAAGAAETHAGTAADNQKATTITGTFTSQSTGSLVGKTLTVAGFATAANNGTFEVLANTGTTTASIANASGASETHAATATLQETSTAVFTFYPDGSQSYVGGTSPVAEGATGVDVVSVSATGLITTNGVTGGSTVEVSYPFANASGTIVVAGKTLPKQKIYADVAVNVVE